MLSWTPSGYAGEWFKVVAGYLPPPPELKPPTLWGTEERVWELLGAGTSSISFNRGNLTHRFRSSQHYADFFLKYQGPALRVYESLEKERREAFRSDLKALVDKFNRAGDGTAIWDADYLIAIAIKR